MVCHEGFLGSSKDYWKVMLHNDEGRPLEVGVQALALNHHELLRSKVLVVSVVGKGIKKMSGKN
jgi:hypothetical protein